MENMIMKAGKDCQNTDKPLHCLNKDIELADDNIVTRRLIRTVKPEHVLLLNSRIPKQIISIDEQYLRCCMEMIKFSAIRATSCNVPLDVRTIFGQLSSRKINSGNACDWKGNCFDGLSVAESKNFVVNSAGDSVLGAITASKSMINILKSPLLRQLGASDSSISFGRTSLVNIGERMDPNFIVGCPLSSDTTSLHKVQKEAPVLRDHIFGYEPTHNRLSSISSTNSSCSDQCSSSSSSALVTQGMLHCTWTNGLPHYVFSIDDQRETYIANMLKAESSASKVLDYTYIFHSRSGGKKEDVIHVKELNPVGKMKVTTSYTLLQDNTEIKETHFVLFGIDDDCARDMQTQSYTHKKNFFSKTFFKASHTLKMRNSSKLGGLSSKLENSSSQPCQGSTSNLEPTSQIHSDDHFPPNLELAAIICKDRIHYNKKSDLGGWGLKFLKKRGNAQSKASVETELPSEDSRHDNGDCSNSMEILIPAGFHGGPRTRNGGPSSLIERWRSDGQCDCGGWDVGCRLTALNARLNRTDVLSQANSHCESKAFNLLVEGTKQDVPLKMANIHDNLYCISYESTLSALQSFSIAIAIIHAESSTQHIQGEMTRVRDKVYRVR